MKTSKVIIVINRTKPHARQTEGALKTFFDRGGGLAPFSVSGISLEDGHLYPLRGWRSVL
jgi:hypothetical protein